MQVIHTQVSGLMLSAAAFLGFCLIPFGNAEGSERTKLLHLAESSAAPALEEFVAHAEDLLPARLKNAMSKPIEVVFEQLPGTDRFGPPACPGAAETALTGKIQYGVTSRISLFSRSHRVVLNAGFLKEILAGPENATSYLCGHKNMYRLALATLLHEVSHVYDFHSTDSSLITPGTAEASLQRQCSWDESMRDGAQSSEACTRLSAISTAVSRRAAFLNISGLGNGLKVVQPRSPDGYEFENAEEAFAVNMEYFLLDPEYACRRPVYAAFLKSHFGAPPVPTRKCELNTQVLVTADDLKSSRLVDLNPSRVYEVHYLLAGPGSETESGFGHAMFRLIVCAPERETVGPECLADVAHHVTLSYRANLTGLQLNKMDGLIGRYPSQLYLLRFLDTVREYTRGELRELLSFPIRLSRKEIRQFVSRALEQYWQYQDRYYFLTKNCATESLNFVRAILPRSELAWKNAGIITPLMIPGLLRQEGRLRDEVLSRADARGRYYFPPISEEGDASLARLRGLNGFPRAIKKTGAYLEKLNAKDRYQLYLDLSKLNPDESLAVHFLTLEALAKDRIRQITSKKLMETALGLNGDTPEWHDVQGKLADLQRLRNELLPWQQAKNGYGIPLAQEALSEAEIRAVLQAISSIFESMGAHLRNALASEMDEMKAISRNMKSWLDELNPAGR